MRTAICGWLLYIMPSFPSAASVRIPGDAIGKEQEASHGVELSGGEGMLGNVQRNEIGKARGAREYVSDCVEHVSLWQTRLTFYVPSGEGACLKNGTLSGFGFRGSGDRQGSCHRDVRQRGQIQVVWSDLCHEGRTCSLLAGFPFLTGRGALRGSIGRIDSGAGWNSLAE